MARRAGEKPRRILGEKGIGRLAIAAIGPAVLVLTRASRSDGLHDLVAALIHWGLFEVPGLDLDRIRIPVRVFPGGTLPEKADMEHLIAIVLNGVTELGDAIPVTMRNRIKTDLDFMKFSPAAVLKSLDNGNSENKTGPSLLGSGHGTHFIIRPYEPVLDDDLSETVYESFSKLERFLIGFGNTMLPNFPSPPINAAFREHRPDGELRDYISDQAFFTPHEYSTADHIIEGRFDKHGQFNGTVKVFDQPPISYTLNWPGAKGAYVKCGSFGIRFGYVMGRQHQSLLPKKEWVRFDAKLKSIGGLYIYRDGIRILPYGNSDYDFLNIEKRRTLSAKDWFFSHRRFYGAILISAEKNNTLREKAGREGFRENIAYRQFKSMLENLLMSLAKDFFRSNAPLGEEFNRAKSEMDARKDLLKKRDELVKVRKGKFRESLNKFFEKVEEGEPGEKTERIKSDFDNRFNAIATLDDPYQMGVELHRIERNLRATLDKVRKNYRVVRPQGIGFTKQMTADWQAFRRVYAELEESRFTPLTSHFDGRLAELLAQRGTAINRRLLLREALENRKQTINKAATRDEREARDGLKRARGSITRGITSSIQRLHNDIELVLSDFERTNTAELSADAIVSLRTTLERRLDGTAARETQFLEKLREQMDALSESMDAGILSDDITTALEDSNQELREELEESLHWAQVGMSLGVVQHEFNGVVRKIKKGIGRLRPWAKGTPELSELFNDLRTGFSHLEEYLRLFPPLDRRLQRQRIDLSGEEIRSYLTNVFEERFKRHAIKFETTDAFRKHTVKVFPSTLLPVFINIVDNACYWLRGQPDARRWIRIDLILEGIIVENGGPGIENRLAERIFDFGFTTKQNGRGMGLSISRRALRHEGLDVTLLEPGINNKVRFLIKLNSDDEME